MASEWYHSNASDFCCYSATEAPTQRHAPETNEVVERFNESLKYEHLYREEIADAQTLDEEVQRFRGSYNRVRPHEALGFLTPESVHLAAPNPSEAESVRGT